MFIVAPSVSTTVYPSALVQQVLALSLMITKMTSDHQRLLYRLLYIPQPGMTKAARNLSETASELLVLWSG